MRRRSFLSGLGAPALLGPSGFLRAHAAELLEELARTLGEPEQVARDESYWKIVQEAFAVDRTLLNLNNGGVCPSPRVVQDSLRRHTEFANGAPAHRMWDVQAKHRDAVRGRLARQFGCDTEEVAITRNASEGLQICQLGIDLDPGDQVLCTDQDYGRMITTFDQRARREGIELVRFPIPVPLDDPAELVRRYAERITDRTRVILVCHVINLTGQVLPVREICALGRERDIPVIVDGAHGFANVVFERDDLGCDIYATSLHKWLFAPFGSGMLYVRRKKIETIWPLMAANESQSGDIRKFEEIGTHSLPLVLSVADALGFHEAIGPERKDARLRFLRDRWLERLARSDRLRLNTNLSRESSCGMLNVGFEGLDSTALASHLKQEHRILTTNIQHRGVDLEGRPLDPDAPLQIDGLRISPGPYATLEEVDRFAGILEDYLRDGLPN